MENELVRYSRAGDVFHYRWAARRCLRMINPKSSLRCVVIEGSKERKIAGEYVIDVAEYSGSNERDDQEITYYQLKHSTKRKRECFNLSDLKDTIEGFAARYREIFFRDDKTHTPGSVKFSIVTNRPISGTFKNGVHAIGKGEAAQKRFQGTLEKYTQLKGEHLREFCISLQLIDGEGDYNAQRHELHAEISELLSGTVDNAEIDSVVALVQDQALPDASGRIVREDILKRFGCTSERDLFPAPPKFEELKCSITREQHEYLLNHILEATGPVIIHAGGGVGKTVTSLQLAESLPAGSIGIVYDCFGSGKYRNRSEPRHRHRDALIQIANEVASQGLCKTLIPRSTDLDDAILRAFLARLRMAATALRKTNKNAVLAVLIDAADNAEMAAKEFSEPCFAHQLLREKVPDGCRIVAFCRSDPERIALLKPSSKVLQLELKPFSEAETLAHLRERFPDATETNGLEFYRLTSCNPRVQTNALSIGHNTISDVLASLGPSGTTVDEQIETQLASAISTVKETYSVDFQKHIESICLGLANLPPFIPINVLATASGVDPAAVTSFVADLGRPLWLSDSSVQFRDEPTETWFRKNFSASAQQIETYVNLLKPLASQFSYVAEVLPSLLLQSENYDQLINLALSDEFLPEDSPIDERNIRVYRLQFAFKAALKQKRYADAAKLALRAGEEVAGDYRQLELLIKNIDIIAPLQSQQRVQELAFRRMLRSAWEGSENVYSAALLSSVEDFKGEAIGYLRAAENWLRLYFDERKKNKDNRHEERLKDEDIVELAFAHFNLFGPKRVVDYILSWRPPEVVFRVARLFIRRLVDAGKFKAIDEISRIGHHNQYFTIAIADELIAVGKFPPADSLGLCLSLLIHKRTRPKPQSHYNEDTVITAIVSFAEACSAKELPHAKILRLLRHYIPSRASSLVSSDYQDRERNIFLRGTALKAVLSGNLELDIETLMSKKLLEKKKDYHNEQDVTNFKQVIGGLLPWYIIRSRILIGDRDGLDAAIQDANQRSKSARAQRWLEYDRIPLEIARLRFEILALDKLSDGTVIEDFVDTLSNKDNQLSLMDLLNAVRAAYRLEHLSKIKNQLEQSCYEIVASASDEGPETRAEWFINLARAVLPISRTDAAAYFNYAIEAVSKFGDEIVERWEAVVAVAKRSTEDRKASPEIAYRFIRCAELVGDNVAREKYFDRNKAIKVCSRLCPKSAFAALSRWRDRYVGWLDRQLPALAYETVQSKILPPTVGWSLSAFSWEYGFIDFAEFCIENETNTACRQYILDTAVRDFRIDSASNNTLQKFENVAQRFSLENTELKQALAFHAEQPETSNDVPISRSSRTDYRDESQDIDWGKALDDLDLCTSAGISNAIAHFDDMAAPRQPEVFWNEIFKRVPENKASDFLEAIITAESTDSYDFQNALSYFPDSWRSKPSVKRIWLRTLSTIAKRFAPELTNYYHLKYFLERIRVEDSVLPLIQKGIMEGLSESCNLVGASTFFGFAGIVAPFITPQEATDLLDYALSRFEEHIDDDYADGPWNNWLIPPEKVEVAFTGFIWAALGSPRSLQRWQAAHCVRRLAETGCEREIDALIEWMGRDSVDSFGSRTFPFYNLHARLYLLIALARVAIDSPEILKRHHAIFEQHALENIPHVLIQKYAAEIAVSIETAFPGTYDHKVIEKLRQVGISQMPAKEINDYGKKFETPWHERGEVDHDLKFHFSYDFDRYWFDPLGNVFGVSAKQVEELAREIVLKDWRMEIEDKFIRDPRDNLWRSRRHERETWHSHSSYPKTDDYRFYLSYHAMFVVAAKLLQEMSVVHRREWCDDEWTCWLHRHTLTRTDGRWLADRRDPVPIVRRAWLHEKKTEYWRWEIIPEDFLDGLFTEHNGETWLNVRGTWSDHENEYEESFHITSALVSSETSRSLLNAIITCVYPWDFALPSFQDRDLELDASPFELHGWIWANSPDKRLDEFDPHAGRIDYPPYRISKSIIERLGLFVDLEQREWHLPNIDKASLVCEIWSASQIEERDGPYRHGKRISASLEFLTKLCSVLEREIIIKVQIQRSLSRSYYTRSNESNEYQPPYCKIYILSADGTIRDERTCYQLRQGSCKNA